MSSRVIYFVVAFCLYAGLVWGQQDRAALSGTVTDSQGAVIVGSRVRAVNENTGFEYPTITNESGFYILPSLPVGDYRLSVQMDGFKRFDRPGIRLQVNSRVLVDVRLEVGSVTESVEVTAAAPLVDTGSAVLGKVIENRRVVDLPINGRNAMALMLLAPGVQSNAGPTNSGFGDRGSMISNVSINGSPNATNNFTLDGAGNNNPFFGDLNVSPSVDAVEEFKVQSGVMSAEFGYTAGGVVNIVSKSGTNAFHGTAYEFLRNDQFDARNTFASSRKTFRYNQFGGALGGPVLRDRLFFFVNYEDYLYRLGSTAILTVPTELQRQGNFSNTRSASGALIPVYDPTTTRANPSGSGFVRDVFAGNTIPTARIDPVARNVTGFYPLPNRAPSNAFTNQNNYENSSTTDKKAQRQFMFKNDLRISDRTFVSGRYAYYRHFRDNPGSNPNPEVSQRTDNYRTSNFVLSVNHTYRPSVLGEFRLSLSRMNFEFYTYTFLSDKLKGPGSVAGGWPAKLGLPASVPSYVFPTVAPAGFATLNPDTSGIRKPWSLTLAKSVTIIRGRHSVKAGGEFWKRQSNNLQYFRASSGNFSFSANLTGNPQSQSGTGSGWATFLTGAVSGASADSTVGESQEGIAYNLFVQDDWRTARRLTLNLGLRYDYQQWPWERNNGTVNFNPSAVSPASGLMGRLEFAGIDFRHSPIQPDRNDLGPRIGFAFDLSGNGRMVLRGGYGIYYPSTFVRLYFPSGQGYAGSTTTYLPPGGSSNFPAFQLSQGFPTPVRAPLGRSLGPDGLLGQGVLFDQNNGRTPLTQQWSLSLQRQIRKNWAFEAAYSASRGTFFPTAINDPNDASLAGLGGYDLNQLDPKYLSLGLALQDRVPNPYAGRVPGSLGDAQITRLQSLLPYPYYSRIAVRNPHIGNYAYHAVDITAEERLSAGVTFLFSYTAGKNINDGIGNSTYTSGSPEQTSVTAFQNGKFNRRAERSIDPTDVSQRLVISSVYELPLGKGKRWAPSNRIANKATEGWQINLISTMQSGLPLVVRGANNNLADRPNSTGKSAKLEHPTPSRWFDTTQFTNPPLYTFGNVGRVLPDVRMPGMVNFDISVMKKTSLTERFKLQFRAEAFNAFNKVNLRGPGVSFVAGPDGRNSSGTFGVITAARDARIFQTALKLIF